jgi:AcrR family transcriptional regulator
MAGSPRLATTVVSICEVSETEFYDLFLSVEECVLAAFDEGVARLSRVIIDSASRQEVWFERVRAGLSALLRFFDEEPGWARLLVLDQSIATHALAERRSRVLATLAHLLEREAHTETLASTSRLLTAELVVGGVVSLLRTRMLGHSEDPFVGLAPSLWTFIAAQYPGPGGCVEPSGLAAERSLSEPQFRRLPVRATYRTTRVLSAIGGSPRLSNRDIADAAGLSDEGQTSKLLRRLERRGLVENVGLGQAFGGANAWILTGYGEEVLEATRHSLVPGAGVVMAQRARGLA